jgi:hypothetical protein
VIGLAGHRESCGAFQGGEAHDATVALEEHAMDAQRPESPMLATHRD